MTANEYMKLAMRTINKNLSTTECMYHALHGMAAEVGEIHSIFQKRYQGHQEGIVEHLKKETGDLMWFIAELCTSMGWDLEEVMQLNIDKLKNRYPEGFEAEKSIHRKAGDI